MNIMQIGQKPNLAMPNFRYLHLPLCKAIELERMYCDAEDEVLLLSFNWVTQDPQTGAIGTANYILPVTGNGIPKSAFGVYFLTQYQKPIVVNFENFKDDIIVECVGKSIMPYDFTLKYKVLR